MYNNVTSAQPIALSIRELLGFNDNNENYEIQIYQRNYAWQEQEVCQLIDDIIDNIGDDKDYYLGNLIVYPRHRDSGERVFETIDGQQRLTTLTLLACALKHKFGNAMFASYNRINISFAHREMSNASLEYIISEGKSGDQPNDNIFAMYNEISDYLENNEVSIDSFCKYFCERVKIIRITLPTDTSLNHYFEVMNSRGEQLEQHEVLKAMMMSKLTISDHSLFAQIWDACSDMEHYVQMNFNKTSREKIFSTTWDSLPNSDFDSLRDDIYDMSDSIATDPKSLNQLFVDDANNTPYNNVANDNEGGQTERFNPVIDFSGFLLHVLKIHLGRNANIQLDDKNLLSQYRQLGDTLTIGFVKSFAVTLLRARYLFDRYMLKREYINSEERWSLKYLKCYNDTKRNNKKPSYVDTYSNGDQNCVMLQSMFHVSSPAYNYKQWMCGALFCLIENCEEITLSEILNSYLEELAKSYMLDRYLQPKEYKAQLATIIHNKNGVARQDISSVNFTEINNGTSVENFIFNFYDYIIWRANRVKYKDFSFAYRTSVEHFYPQTPPDGFLPLPNNGDDGHLHNFGNLCIMSRGDNSKFSNNMPEAKVGNFYKLAKGGRQSLKLIEMMEIVNRDHRWWSDEIKDTYNIAEERFITFLG